MTSQMIDEVKIRSVSWMYEPRLYYQHSFLLLETDLSAYERVHRKELGIPKGQTTKYYVTEKNDLGVIWNVFYDLRSATLIKTEHDGHRWERLAVYKLKEISVDQGNQMTVRKLKLIVNNADHTTYDLVWSNCHKYAYDIVVKYLAVL